MQYRFSDLVDLSGFQQVMQSWYSVAGVATALLDTERNSLCAVGWQDICARFHQLSPEAGGRCTYSDDTILSHLREGSYVAHQCVNGLMNCAMPVVVNGEHVASLFMGQFLHEPPDEAFFRQQAHELGVDEAAYLAALRQVPIISEERLLAVMAAQTRLAQMLATMGLEHKQILGTSATFNTDLIKAQQHIALMLHTAQTASGSLEPVQVLERAADAMVTAVDASYCGIYLMDTERGVLVPHVVRAPSADDLAGLRERHLDPALDSLAGEVLQRQAPAVCTMPRRIPVSARRCCRPGASNRFWPCPSRLAQRCWGLRFSAPRATIAISPQTRSSWSGALPIRRRWRWTTPGFTKRRAGDRRKARHCSGWRLHCSTRSARRRC